ncbi:MmgE/PrpD family protein [Bordetella bronchiseptica]
MNRQIHEGSDGLAIAERLAAFLACARNEELPSLALEHAKMVVASTIASAAVGHGIDSARIVREIEIECGGRPEAAVWFHGARMSARGAARCNAVASDAAASDDSDLHSIAHIGTIVSTAAIAMAERSGCCGADVLRAIVLGYEVASRIDSALAPGRMRRGFHGSAATAFGSAVSTGVVLGLDSGQMTHAIALAATSIGGLAIAADTSWAREYHAGVSVNAGINAALAARLGYRAEPRALEGPRGFVAAMGGALPNDFCADLGASWRIVTNLAIKLMPGGHHYHAIAEAAAAAAAQGNVKADDIDRIVVGASQFTGSHGPTHPRDLVDAAHSLAYFAAAAVADYGFRWEHIINAEKMRDPIINDLLDKVSVDCRTPPSAQLAVLERGGTVTLVMKNGNRISKTCGAPRGSGPRGIEWTDVAGKFHALLPISGMASAAIDACLDTIHALDRIDNLALLTRHLSNA